MTSLTGSSSISIVGYVPETPPTSELTVITGTGRADARLYIEFVYKGITLSNSLYELLNFDLASTGNSTWINLWGLDPSYVIQGYVDPNYV